jgi:cation/acetate symporter
MLVAMYINCFVAAIVLLVLGYGALAFLISNQPGLLADPARLVGGPNMAVMHLARIVGGDALFGSIAAVLFATILAVVSGLTVVCSGSIAHDIYAQALMRGKVSEAAELRVFRLSSLAVTVLAVLLAIAFRHKNVTFLVGLAFAVASSANFPVLLLSMYWRGLTKYGAIASCVTGLVTSVGLIVASPTVWVELLHNSRPLFPSAYPAMISVPLAFVTAYVVSVMERLGRRNSFQERPLSSL